MGSKNENGNYYLTPESVSEYIQLAKDVSGLDNIQILKKYLKPGTSILEFGSGPGTDWRILNKDYQVTGSDFSKFFIQHLEKENPGHSFLHLDAASFKLENKFDAIYSNKVLHHLSDTALLESIKNQAGHLLEKGIISHSFWKGEGSENFKGMYVNYHTKAELIQLIQSYFEVLYLEEYQEFEPKDSLLLIARKKGE